MNLSWSLEPTIKNLGKFCWFASNEQLFLSPVLWAQPGHDTWAGQGLPPSPAPRSQGSAYFSSKDKALRGKTPVHNSTADTYAYFTWRVSSPWWPRVSLQPPTATEVPSVTQVLPNTSQHHFPYTVLSKSVVGLLVTTQESLSNTSTKMKEIQGQNQKGRLVTSL